MSESLFILREYGPNGTEATNLMPHVLSLRTAKSAPSLERTFVTLSSSVYYRIQSGLAWYGIELYTLMTLMCTDVWYAIDVTTKRDDLGCGRSAAISGIPKDRKVFDS